MKPVDHLISAVLVLFAAAFGMAFGISLAALINALMGMS